jgi:hypothetical protein
MCLQGKDTRPKQLTYEDVDADYMLVDSIVAANLKRSPAVAQTSTGKKMRGDKNETSNNYKERPWHYKFWYGYPIMEEQAKLAGRAPQETAPTETLLELGLNTKEVQELATTRISFLRISQHEWPQERDDKVLGQYYHLTQIPFVIDIDQETGLVLVYQIFLYFEKPTIVYTRETTTNLAKTRFQEMQIELGNILEPIVPFCSSRDERA